VFERDAVEPAEVLRDLLGLDPGLRRESYYGEQSVFYNPGRVAPLGVIFASIKDHDGANDRSANLMRAGVYRLAFQLPRDDFVRRFGAIPERPPKGGVVALPGYDPTRVNELMPHPVYAWMRWVQILAPTADQFESLRPLLAESLELVRAKWKQRKDD
jgi:Family of unknown function (DUF6194)